MRLVILGARGYGRTVADLAEQTGRYESVAFLDDRSPEALGPCGDFESHVGPHTCFYAAFGNNSL